MFPIESLQNETTIGLLLTIFVVMLLAIIIFETVYIAGTVPHSGNKNPYAISSGTKRALSILRILPVAGLIFFFVLGVELSAAGACMPLPNYDADNGLCDFCGKPATVTLGKEWTNTVYHYIGGNLASIDSYFNYFVIYPVDLPRNDTFGEYCMEHLWIAEWNEGEVKGYGDPSYGVDLSFFAVFSAIPLFIYIVFFAHKLRKWIRSKKKEEETKSESMKIE